MDFQVIDINSKLLQNVDRANSLEQENLTVTNEIYDLKSGKHQITEEIKIQKSADLIDSKSTKSMKVRKISRFENIRIPYFYIL